MNFAAGYVGSAADSQRIRRQEKEREEAKKKYEAAYKGIQDEVDRAGLRQFAPTTTEALEHAFKNETIGLVTKEEFVKKRCTLAERMEEEKRRAQEAEEQAQIKERERKRLLKMGAGAKKLSFAMDDGEEEDEEGGKGSPAPSAPAFKLPAAPAATAAAASTTNGSATNAAGSSKSAAGDAAANANRAAASSIAERLGGSAGGAEVGAAARSASPAAENGSPGPPDAKKPRKVGKNPTALTDFLPDRERARKEQELREQLKKEYQAQQDLIKSEPLCIVYSYWDGTGHRREIKIKKGDTIGSFLKAVREQLVTEFRELRHVSVDNLLYVKEDIIMPHHYSFHDLIASKARGKSGPLFDFGVHEDIRVVSDASREKSESHAGKVVERHWYDRNKHIFPASRWEVYDPEKKYDSYSIYG